jgi:very-short-patch-repair endonuclease
MKRLTHNELINKFKKTHVNKYDYSLVEYKNNSTKIKIICPEHGVFECKPIHHINGTGCSMCSGYFKLNNETFIEKVKKIHGDKYDYSMIDYKNNKTKIKIICPEHGIFEQTPNAHNKQGCKKCAIKENSKLLSGANSFIGKAKKIHGDTYDYSLVEYVNALSEVKIVCKKHGVFKQKPNKHLSGKNGCPICKSSKGELEIKNWLEKNNICYKQQYRFPNCRNIRPLPFDFYLPNLNICVEYDGRQHFKAYDVFGGEKGYSDLIRNDNIKKIFCEKNNITLLKIKYNENIFECLKKFIYL